jgi:hypothetical protein
MRPLFPLTVCGALCALVFTNIATAWNSPGHETVALVAYSQLDEATRAKAVELLRAHPRFRDHFQSFMPKEILRGTEAEQHEWIFAHAATWPDLIREAKGAVNRQDVREYGRSWWHFIDEPIYLSDSERPQLEHQLGVNLSRELPQDPDDEYMNIIQALKNSSRIVRDVSASKAKRAIHMCWVLHLAGDSHQPLHSCALFTTRRFPGGDHGGNYLEIQHGWKLHGFWDDQISDEATFKAIRNGAECIGKDPRLVAAGKKAAEKLDPGDWIDESFGLAKRVVYTKEVLDKVAAREAHSHLAPLDLSLEYKAQAEAVAEQRAVEAGYRLAATIQKLLQ